MSKIFSKTELMEKAIEEQKKSNEFPKVGVVIAKDGRILSTGFRGEIPKTHAERVALGKLQDSEINGATIVTTLEPCVEFFAGQPQCSCSELLSQLPIKEVIVGVLDPNGKIYAEGYAALNKAGIKVSFFDPQLRAQVEQVSFRDGDVNRGHGPNGTRRVGVVGSAGKRFIIHRSKADLNALEIRWRLIQSDSKGWMVDLQTAHDNNAVREATGARDFDDISDPLVFRETCHFARMHVGDIAVIYPENFSFATLIKLKELTEHDLLFKWEIRHIIEVKN